VSVRVSLREDARLVHAGPRDAPEAHGRAHPHGHHVSVGQAQYDVFVRSRRPGVRRGLRVGPPRRLPRSGDEHAPDRALLVHAARPSDVHLPSLRELRGHAGYARLSGAATAEAKEAPPFDREAFRARWLAPGALITVLAGFLLLGQIGSSHLSNFDDCFYAQRAKEMLHGGDWITPHWNGEAQVDN